MVVAKYFVTFPNYKFKVNTHKCRLKYIGSGQNQGQTTLNKTQRMFLTFLTDLTFSHFYNVRRQRQTTGNAHVPVG